MGSDPPRRGRPNIFEEFSLLPYQSAHKHAKNLLKLKEEEENDGDGYAKKGESKKSSATNNLRSRLTVPPRHLIGSNVGDQIESLWRASLKHKQRPNLCWVLFKTMKWEFLRLVALVLFVRLGCILSMIELIRRILLAVEEWNEQIYKFSLQNHISNKTQLHEVTQYFQEQGDDFYEGVINHACLLLIPISLHTILFSNMKLERAICGLKCRAALSQIIARKSQRLSLSASIAESSSVAIDLVANEVSIIEEANTFLVYTIVGPLVLLAGPAYLALIETGLLPILGAYSLILVIMLVQRYLPGIYHNATINRKNETKIRVEVTSNFLDSIKLAKMYSWERVFRKVVDFRRDIELTWLRKVDKLVVVDAVTSSILFKLLPAIVFVIYIYLHNKISTTIIFTIAIGYSNFNVDGILLCARGTKNLIDMMSSCKKIEDYLLLPDVPNEKLTESTNHSDEVVAFSHSCISEKEPVSIKCTNLTISYETVASKESPTTTTSIDIVSNLSSNLQQSELVMLIGPVGGGKSTLLMSILKEIKPRLGSIEKCPPNARIAYASQEPWILAETVRDNILLGRPFDADRYKSVVSACSLLRDFNLMPQGDETLVGSKGVSLSGGQKARINLARAVYSVADIYLLDDPLAAVDSKVAKHIFEKCVKEFLADKLVILATHQRQFLQQADQVISTLR